MKAFCSTPQEFPSIRRRFFPALLASSVLALVVPVANLCAREDTPAKPARDSSSEASTRSAFFNDLLPMALQKRPKVRYNVFTEMTPAGRELREPSPDHPTYYFAPPGAAANPGWLPYEGEKPPPWPALKDTMEKALAENGYLPVADDGQRRPDLLIVFSYGSHATDLGVLAPPEDGGEPVNPPMHADELLYWLTLHPKANYFAIMDVIDRARFIGGAKVAQELYDSFKWGGIENLLYGAKGETMAHVVELAFHTCYFVTATAFDFSGVEKKQRRLLWQTRMTIEANGVDIGEVLKPLIVNTGAFIGRETPEAVIVDKRLDRTGRVEVGTPEVVPDTPAKH